VTYFGVDPNWDDARLRAFADAFDVILATVPPDLRDQTDRRFMSGYRERLLASGAWSSKELGTVEIARPLKAPLRVTLYACRRKT
jgi:hypothetical protein